MLISYFLSKYGFFSPSYLSNSNDKNDKRCLLLHDADFCTSELNLDRRHMSYPFGETFYRLWQDTTVHKNLSSGSPRHILIDIFLMNTFFVTMIHVILYRGIKGLSCSNLQFQLSVTGGCLDNSYKSP